MAAKMAQGRASLLTALCIVLLAASCDKPADSFSYIAYEPGTIATNVSFDFEAMMDESGTLYSTAIACRYDASRIDGNTIPLYIQTISPQGHKYGETIDFPLSKNCEGVTWRKAGGTLVDIQWNYRDRINPAADTGIWQVRIMPATPKVLDGICGIGFNCSRMDSSTRKVKGGRDKVETPAPKPQVAPSALMTEVPHTEATEVEVTDDDATDDGLTATEAADDAPNDSIRQPAREPVTMQKDASASEGNIKPVKNNKVVRRR